MHNTPQNGASKSIPPHVREAFRQAGIALPAPVLEAPAPVRRPQPMRLSVPLGASLALVGFGIVLGYIAAVVATWLSGRL